MNVDGSHVGQCISTSFIA